MALLRNFPKNHKATTSKSAWNVLYLSTLESSWVLCSMFIFNLVCNWLLSTRTELTLCRFFTVTQFSSLSQNKWVSGLLDSEIKKRVWELYCLVATLYSFLSFRVGIGKKIFWIWSPSYLILILKLHYL